MHPTVPTLESRDSGYILCCSGKRTGLVVTCRSVEVYIHEVYLYVRIRTYTGLPTDAGSSSGDC